MPQDYIRWVSSERGLDRAAVERKAARKLNEADITEINKLYYIVKKKADLSNQIAAKVNARSC